MSGHQPGAPAGAEAASPDPSMDDILASIRRILNEEDTPATAPEPAPAALAPPAPVHVPAAEPAEPDVLELDHSMMVQEPAPAPVPAEEAPPPPMAVAFEAPVPEAMPFPQAVPVPEPVSFPQAVPASISADPLVAPEAAAAAAVSVGALMRTLAHERSTATHRGGPTIEELVRDEMRPLLKMWLDLHLAPMVERLVRAEIERVVSRMT